MNRYSLIFALLVASSFAIHPTRSGDTSPPAAPIKAATGTTPKKNGDNLKAGRVQELLFEDSVPFVQSFLEKAATGSKPIKSLQILYATVRIRLETHLAAAFKYNVDAIQDGLQEAMAIYSTSLL